MASSPTIVQKNAKAKVQSQSLLGLGKKKILEKDYQKAISLFSEAI
jgi:Flp pilus assembly protein TadD